MICRSKIIFQYHRHAATSIPTSTAKIADATINTPTITRWWLERRAPYPLLQAHHSQFQSERQLHLLPAGEHKSMPSLSSSGLARNRNHTVKLSEFLISRSTLGIGIARGAHHDENFASAMSHHRMFTNSCRWMNKPSACSRDREGSMNHSDNNVISSENEKSTVDHGNKHHINSDKCNIDSRDTTPINQHSITLKKTND